MQSRLLVWIAAPVLAGLCLQAAMYAMGQDHGIRFSYTETLGISLGFSVVVWSMRAATAPAALCGGMICLLITFFTGPAHSGLLRTGLTPLMALFLLTFAATRAGRSRKVRLGLAESRRGRRASQVLANLGAAGLASSIAGSMAIAWAASLFHRALFVPYAVPIILLAALGEATADTVSSEIGQAFGGPPVLVTSLRPVQSGTDGGITFFGTAAGVLGAVIVLTAGAWALQVPFAGLLIALAGAVGGLFFDSLLGATLEGKGWLGNDLVNFASTVFAALLAFLLVLMGSPGAY